VCAFGGLADGFLPFDVGGGRAERLTLASVVMKAVQARRPRPVPAAARCRQSGMHLPDVQRLRVPGPEDMQQCCTNLGQLQGPSDRSVLQVRGVCALNIFHLLVAISQAISQAIFASAPAYVRPCSGYGSSQGMFTTRFAWAQAHAPDCSADRCTECAGKLGDDANKGKAQVMP